MTYIGMDVHKQETQICIEDAEGAVMLEQRIRTTRERFTALLGGRPPARILLEAATESEWVAQHLETLGHAVIVADPNYAAEALNAGGSAYILKSSAVAEILLAIREVLNGRIYVSPSLNQEVVRVQMERAGKPEDAQTGLTPRQREVLRLLAEGKSLKEVAAALKISIKTVEFHKYRIMNQLGIRTNADMTKYAVKAGVTRL